MAGNLQCPKCTEAKRARPAPGASLKETPALFQILGKDCFEFEHAGFKHKFLLMRDRASGYVMLEFLQTCTGNWEPTTENITAAFCRWLMVNPMPQWSPQTVQRTSPPIRPWSSTATVQQGDLTAPAEAHEMLGAEEGRIRVLKETAVRLPTCSSQPQWGHWALGIFSFSGVVAGLTATSSCQGRARRRCLVDS